jgi:hypothetical protein
LTLRVSPSPAALTASGYIPRRVPFGTRMRRIDACATGFGLKDRRDPGGSPLTVGATVAAKPLAPATVSA